MNAIINMYKEFANIHRQEHAKYGWTEHAQTGTKKLD